MIQQYTQRCQACDGIGQIIDKKDQCPKCSGKKTTMEKKILEVFIEKGTENGERIVYEGEGEHTPGTYPGNVILYIKELEHSLFRRKGEHLVMQKSISLMEALTGYKFSFKHLDGRVIEVKSPLGEVIKPGNVRGIKEYGMPIKGNMFSYGNIYVVYDVEFPLAGSLSETQIAAIKKTLKPSGEKKKQEGTPSDSVEATVMEIPETQRRQRREVYDQDSDGEGREVRCGQM